MLVIFICFHGTCCCCRSCLQLSSSGNLYTFRKKKTRKKKSAPPKTHHEIHSSPATASISRRYTRKHVPRVSPYSLTFIDPVFVEIGHVQFSQSVKTTNATHRQTDRQTDRLINNGTLYAPRYEKAFLPNGLGRFGRFASSALSLY